MLNERLEILMFRAAAGLADNLLLAEVLRVFFNMKLESYSTQYYSHN